MDQAKTLYDQQVLLINELKRLMDNFGKENKDRRMDANVLEKWTTKINENWSPLRENDTKLRELINEASFDDYRKKIGFSQIDSNIVETLKTINIRLASIRGDSTGSHGSSFNQSTSNQGDSRAETAANGNRSSSNESMNSENSEQLIIRPFITKILLFNRKIDDMQSMISRGKIASVQQNFKLVNDECMDLSEDLSSVCMMVDSSENYMDSGEILRFKDDLGQRKCSRKFRASCIENKTN